MPSAILQLFAWRACKLRRPALSGRQNPADDL